MKKAIKGTTVYTDVDDSSHEAYLFDHLVSTRIPNLQFYDGVRLYPDSYGMRWRKVVGRTNLRQFARVVFRNNYHEKVSIFCDGDADEQELTWEQALEHLARFANSE